MKKPMWWAIVVTEIKENGITQEKSTDKKKKKKKYR